MAEKNVRINVKTSTGYDQLYPESKSDIVNFDKSNSDISSTNVETAIKEVNTKANTNKTNIGTLTSLTTDSKTNLVGAINEVDSHANTNKTNIGMLSSLKTTIKTSIVNAINSLYDSIIGKTLKTLDEVSVATEEGYYVDALAIKELTDTETAELRNNFNNLFGYAERRGKQVSITSVFAQNQWTYQTASWATIGTLPASMCPLRQQNGVAIYGNAQDNTTGFRVTTDGQVQAYFPVGSGQYLSFSTSYFTE